MKLIILFILLLGCTTSRYYHADDVAHHLRDNAAQIEGLALSVDQDYQQKKTIFSELIKMNAKKNAFIYDDLNWRMKNLGVKRKIFIERLQYFGEQNKTLLKQVSQKTSISEKDPEFKKIEKFSEGNTSVAERIVKDFKAYQEASEEFMVFVLFSKSVLKQATSYIPRN